MGLSPLLRAALKPISSARSTYQTLTPKKKTTVLIAGIGSIAILIFDAYRAINLRQLVKQQEFSLSQGRATKVTVAAVVDTDSQTPVELTTRPFRASPYSRHFIFSYWPAARLNKLRTEHTTLAEKVSNINGQIKKAHQSLINLKNLQSEGKELAFAVRNAVTLDSSYSIDFLNEVKKAKLVAYCSKTIESVTQFLEATAQNSEEFIGLAPSQIAEKLEEVSKSFGNRNVKKALNEAIKVCRLLAKLDYPLDKLVVLDESSTAALDERLPVLKKAAREALNARKAQIKEVVKTFCGSIDLSKLERDYPELSARFDSQIKPHIMELTELVPLVLSSEEECRNLSLTPIEDSEDVCRLFKIYFLNSSKLYVDDPSKKATLGTITTHLKQLRKAYLLLILPKVYERAGKVIFLRGQNRALVSQEHFLYALFNSKEIDSLYQRFFSRNLYEESDATHRTNLEAVDIFCDPDISSASHKIRDYDLALTRITEEVFAPYMSNESIADLFIDAVEQSFPAHDILCMLAHIQEYYPLFEFPLNSYKASFDRYKSYLTSAEELTKACPFGEVFFKSRLQSQARIVSAIIEDFIPFLGEFHYSQSGEDKNPIIEGFNHFLLDQSGDENNRVRNSILIMFHLGLLEDTSQALETLKDAFIKPFLGETHNSLDHLQEAFEWIQQLKAEALRKLLAKAPITHQEDDRPRSPADEGKDDEEEEVVFSPTSDDLLEEMKLVALSREQSHVLNPSYRK